MAREAQPVEKSDIEAGLCSCCLHDMLTRSAKGAVFHRCGLAARDPRFPKYPRLPVHSCPGWQARPAATKG
jgi:hypothetical protein